MRKTVIVFVLCVLSVAGIMLWGFRDPEASAVARTPRYALILSEDRGTQVLQLKQGAQYAAGALGAELTVYTAGLDETEGSVWLESLEALASAPLDGLILTPCGEAAAGRAARLCKDRDIPLVVLWEPLPGQEDLPLVRTDDREQGRLLAEAAGAPKQAVAFVTGDARALLRLEGLQAILGPALSVRQADPDQPLSALLDGLAEGCQVFLLTGELTAQARALQGSGAAVWGVDPGEDRVSLLTEGAVRGLVMEMPYAQGYLAVQALQAGSGQRAQAAALISPSRVVTPETMFRSENVKLVFPLAH